MLNYSASRRMNSASFSLWRILVLEDGYSNGSRVFRLGWLFLVWAGVYQLAPAGSCHSFHDLGLATIFMWPTGAKHLVRETVLFGNWILPQPVQWDSRWIGPIGTGLKCKTTFRELGLVPVDFPRIPKKIISSGQFQDCKHGKRLCGACAFKIKDC